MSISNTLNYVTLVCISVVLYKSRQGYASYTFGDCRAPLGVSSGIIQDYQFTSSGGVFVDNGNYYPPWKARPGSTILGLEGEKFATNQANEWLQIDLFITHRVSEILIRANSGPSYVRYSTSNTAPASDDLWTDYTGGLVMNGDVLELDYLLEARFVRLVFGSAVEVEEVELYGCPAFVQGEEVEPNYMLAIGVYDDGCKVYVELEVTHIVTTIVIDTTTTVLPAYDQMQVFTNDRVENYTQVPIEKAEFLNGNQHLTLTLGHVVKTTELQVLCDMNWAACKSLTIYGSIVTGCPPTFAEFEGKCYRSVPFRQQLETEEEKNICSRMVWGGEAVTLALPSSLPEFTFLDYFAGDDSDINNMFNIGIFIQEYDQSSGIILYEYQGDSYNLTGNFNLMNFVDESSRSLSGIYDYCTAVHGFMNIHECADPLPYICETNKLGNGPGCHWVVLKGTQASHENQIVVKSLLLSECMNLCQTSNCSSISYNNITYDCFLSDEHTTNVEFTFVPGQPTWTTLDWYCFQDEEAVCMNDVRLSPCNGTIDPDLCRSTSGLCPDTDCGRLLLMPDFESLSLTSAYVTSTLWSSNLSAAFISPFRLDGSIYQPWTPSGPMPLLMIEFSGLTRVSKMFLACGVTIDCDVQQFEVLMANTSINDVYQPYYSYDGKKKVLDGCTDGAHDTNVIVFDPTIVTEKFLVLLTQTSTSFCLQFELYGCRMSSPISSVLEETVLGMGDGTIQDYQLSADSFASAASAVSPPWQARLGNDIGLITALENHYVHLTGSWIQVDLITIHEIMGVSFGPGPSGSIVQTFKIQTSTNMIEWDEVTDDNGAWQVFEAQFHYYFITHTPLQNVNARALRIFIQSTNTPDKKFVFEVYGHPNVTACPELNRIMNIDDVIISGSGSCACGLESDDVIQGCVDSAVPMEILITLNRYYILHGLHVELENASAITSFDIQTMPTTLGTFSTFNYTRRQDESNVNSEYYVGRKPQPVMSIDVYVSSEQSQCLKLKIRACTSPTCPPNYVEHYRSCYSYRKGALTTLDDVSLTDLGQECNRQSWQGTQGHLSQFTEINLDHLRDIFASEGESFYMGAIIPSDTFYYSARYWDWITGSNFEEALEWMDDVIYDSYYTRYCTVLTESGLHALGCATPRPYICQITLQDTPSIVNIAWNPQPEVSIIAVSGSLTITSSTGIECMRTCSDRELLINCKAAYFEGTNCVLLPDYTTATPAGTGYYYELYYERHLVARYLTLDPELLVLVDYPTTLLYDINILNNDTTPIKEINSVLGVNFELTLYFTTHDLSSEAPNTDLTQSSAIVQSYALDIYNDGTNPDVHSRSEGVDVMSSINLRGNATILIPDTICDSIAYACVVISEGRGGYVFIDPWPHSHFECLPIAYATDLRCDGLNITNLTLNSSVALDDAVETHVESVNLTYYWDSGSHMFCSLDLGDGSIALEWNQSTAVIDYYSGSHVELYTFQYPGNFSVSITCTNNIGTSVAYTYVTAEIPVADALLVELNYTSGVVPLTIDILISVLGSYALSYSADVNVTCFHDFTNDGATVDDLVYELTVSASGVVLILSPIYTEDSPSGNVTSRFTCENHISSDSHQYNIILREPVTGSSIIPSAPGFVVGTPAQFTVSVTSGSHVWVEVNYGDSPEIFQEEPVNDIILNPPSWTISHIYSYPATYTVTINQLFNEHYEEANVPVTCDVTIQNIITDLILTPQAQPILYPPAIPDFFLSEGPSQNPLTDISCEWTVTPGGETWTTNLTTYPATFDPTVGLSRSQDSSETLIGDCSNLVTSSYIVSTDFDIFIDDVVIISMVSTSDWWQNLTTITVILEPIHSFASLTFDMGDLGTTCQLDYPSMVVSSADCLFTAAELLSQNIEVTLNYTYADWGDYTAELSATNAHTSIYHDIETVAVSVLEWTCFPPDIALPGDVTNGNVRGIMRSESDIFEVTVLEIHCMKTQDVLYDWEILQNGVAMHGGLDVTSSELILPIRHLDYFVYTLQVRVTMDVDTTVFGTHNPPVYQEAQGLIRIVRSPVVPILLGSDELLEVHHNAILTLDGSGSYDPDLDPPIPADALDDLVFEWHCLQEIPASPIDQSNPAAVVESMCDDLLTTLTYNLPIVEVNIQDLVVAGLESLTAEHYYVFQMDVSKALHPPSEPVQIRVHVLTSAAPVLEILCEHGCDGSHPILVAVDFRKLFSYNCSDNCETIFGGLTQIWSLHQIDSNGNRVEVNLAEEPGIFLTDSSTLRAIIGPNQLESNTDYVVTVNAITPGSSIGHAEFEFHTVGSPPYNGLCSVSQDSGVVLTDVITITCVDWLPWIYPGQENLSHPLDYTLLHKSNDSDEYRMYSTNQNGVFQVNNFPIGFQELAVEVCDSAKSITQYVDLDLIEITPVEYPTTLDLVAAFTSLVNSLDTTQAEQTINTLLAMISILDTVDPATYGIEREISAEEVDQGRQGLIGLREQMAGLIQSLPVTPDLLASLIQVTESVAGHEEQFSENLMLTASEIFLDVAQMLVTQMANANIDDMNSLTASLLSGINSMVLLGETLVPELDNETISDTLVDAFKNFFETMLLMPDAFAQYMFEGEQELVTGRNVYMITSKQDASTVFGNSLAIGEASIDVPVTDDMPSGCVTTKMMLTTGNALIYGNGSRSMNSDLLSMEIQDGCDGSSRKKRSAASNSEYGISLPVGRAELIEVLDIYDHSRIIFHNLNVTDSEQNVLVSIHPRPELVLDVYLNYDFPPSTRNYVHKITIPQNISDGGDTSDQELYELERTFELPAENLTMNNVSLLYIGVLINGCATEYNNCTVRGESLYSYALSQPRCQVWDPSTEEWLMDQCEIVPGSTAKSAKFKSNLLGSLGAGIDVGPNTIDFSTVFDDPGAKLIENAAVVGTVIGIIILFIPLCILCRRYDKKDHLKWSILPLADNSSEDEHCYEVHVYTGLKGKAGTDSQVFMVVAGTESDSGIRPLRDGVRTKMFGQGDVTSFLMSTPDSLGVPVTLKVWHDNSGLGTKASWFLSKIVVVDFKQDKWYVFLCDNWLAVDHGDGCLERVIRPSTRDELASSTSLLQGNIKRQLFDDHIWLSIGYRKTRSTFTRVQRLCCCLAILYLTMISNAMWYKDGNADESSNNSTNAGATETAIEIGPISLTMVQLYASIMSSIIVVPPVLIMTTIFANARIKSKPNIGSKVELQAKTASERDEGSKQAKRKFPWWTIILAYILIVLSVVVSAFFTILYAFQWGKEKSEAWLVTFILSFFESVILVQPLKVVLVSVLITFLMKKDTEVSTFEQELGAMEDRDDKLNPANDDLIGPGQTLTQEEKDAARKQVDLDQKFKAMMSEIFLQVALVLLMAMVVMGNVSTEAIYQNTHLKDVFLDGIPDDGSKAGLFEWLQGTMIENLYRTHTYTDRPLNAYNSKFISSGYAMRLGPPRLRQLRVVPEKCSVSKYVRGYVEQCGHKYSSSYEDMSDYLPEWTRNAIVVHSADQEVNPLQEAFKYQTEEELKGMPFWGERNTYSGGGYVANLGNQKTQALNLVEDLLATNWINRYTRALFVEFNVWNANTNLFNYVIICFELPTEGSFTYRVEIETIVLYRYVGGPGLIALLLEIILTIVMIVLLVLQIIAIVKHGWKYVREFWNAVKLCATVLYFIAIALYIWRSVLTVSTVEEMMNNRDQSINFTMVSIVNKYYVILMGTSVFLIQLSSLHILRYSKTIACVGQTILKSAIDLCNVGVCMLIAILAFTGFMYLHFGKELYEYRSMGVTLTTLVSGCLGSFNYQNVKETQGDVGSVMLLAYLFFMIFFMMSVFMSVLCDWITAIKEDPNAVPKDHEVIQHMETFFKSILGLGQTEPNDCKDSDMSKEDKEDEQLKSEVLLGRVKLLEQVTSRLERSPITNAISELLHRFLTHRASSSDELYAILPEDLNSRRESEYSDVFYEDSGKNNSKDFELLVETAMILQAVTKLQDEQGKT